MRVETYYRHIEDYRYRILEIQATLKFFRTLQKRSAIVSARDAERELYSALGEAEDLLDTVQSARDDVRNLDLADLAETSALGKTYGEANDILWTQLNIALQVNQEFDFENAVERLYRAVMNENTIQLRPVYGTGKVTVNINLNETAGNLEDYGNAISAVREAGGFGKLEPGMASWFWENFLYRVAREGAEPPKKQTSDEGGGKGKGKGKSKKKGKERKEHSKEELEEIYWATMNLRLEASDSLAPFWSIINYGTRALVSDRGGVAYPQAAPTHFVLKAQNKIRGIYSQFFKQVYTEVNNAQKDLIRLLNNMTQQVRRLISAINQLMSTIQEAQERMVQRNFDMIMRNLEQMGKDALVDINRVERLARDMVEDAENIPSRVSLGGGVRIRTPRLIRGI